MRNYTARNFLRAMRRGDRAFFYHSSCDVLGVVGEMTVIREAHPDPTQFDRKSDYHDPASTRAEPRWSAVGFRYVRHYGAPVTRTAMQRDPLLKRMRIFTEGRLSVTPVTASEWRRIIAMAAGPKR